MEILHPILKITLILSASLYLLSWILVLKCRKQGHHVFIAGWLANLMTFILNWICSGAPPFGNMYHVLVFLGLCFLPIHLLLRSRNDTPWAAAYFHFASAIPVAGALFMDPDLAWRRTPALQSAWFVPHVTSYMIAYALSTIAFTIMLVKYFRRIVVRETEFSRYGEYSWQILRLSFPFLTFGLLSGAIWADDAWGLYWSWDPKETWALLTWALYLLYLHLMVSRSLNRYSDIFHIFAYISLLATFIAVNVLPRFSGSLHSYG